MDSDEKLIKNFIIYENSIYCVSFTMIKLVGLIFVFNPKFKSHPYPFIGWSCIVEGAMMYQAIIVNYGDNQHHIITRQDVIRAIA